MRFRYHFDSPDASKDDTFRDYLFFWRKPIWPAFGTGASLQGPCKDLL